MGETSTNGRTPALGQILTTWEALAAPRTWAALTTALGGLAESLCVIRWMERGGAPIIDQAGAQAVLAQGTMLTGLSVDALTPGRNDGTRETSEAARLARPVTVEDTIGDRRIARLYLPLSETPMGVACAIIRID